MDVKVERSRNEASLDDNSGEVQLANETQDSKNHPQSETRIVELLKCITVEPVLFGCAFIIAMYTIIGRVYIYSQIAKKCGIEGNQTKHPCENTTNTSDPDYYLEAKVSAETSNWILYLNIVTFGASTLSTTVLGPWSDKVGRQVPMLIALSGMLFLITTYVFVVNFTLPIQLLLLGHLVCGLSGDYGTVLACSYSHIADVSEENRRTFRVAVADFTLGIAGFSASILGGRWLDAQGISNPFWLLLAIAITNIVYTHIRFESTMRGSFFDNLKYLAKFQSVVHIYDVVKWNDDGGRRRVSILLYTLCYFIVLLAVFGVQDVLLIYEIGVPFCWNSVYAGYSLAAMQLGYIANLVLMRIFRGLRAEGYLVVTGVVANVAFCTTLAFAKKSWHIVLALCFQLFTMTVSPVLKSQMSRLVSGNEIGAIFALEEVSRNFGALIASFLFNGIFSATIESSFPGAVFLVGNAVHLVFISVYWTTFLLSKEVLCSPQTETEEREQLTATEQAK